jgi:hypothetical protein
VYVLQATEQKQVAILYRATSAIPAGTSARIPETGWLTTQLDEPAAAVGCPHAIDDSEWPGLLSGGHDGDMKKGGSASTG